ncbi:sialate O-acetylesterase-like [Styela clava]
MVLQSEPLRAILWGYGMLGATVEVSLNVFDVYKTVVRESINGTGVWSVTFNLQMAGTRGTISASHKYNGAVETYFISNIIFGDVWICGGQSNMEFPLGHIFNSSATLKNVSMYHDIRIFTASQVTSPVPLYDMVDIAQAWAVPSAVNAQYFSAVCWLYAQNIYNKIKKPLGLISSNWGGTPVEAWSSPQALANCNLDKVNSYISMSPQSNSVLWNAMIHPLLNMTISGAIWYQGEQNAHYHRNTYNCSFPAMIKDWRKSWYKATKSQTKSQFPFGFVQLCTVAAPKETGRFPLIRWHQTSDYGYVPNKMMPNTFMAVTLDLPDPNSPYGSIHPRDKQDVGFRLATEALKYVYKVLVHDDGPFPVSATLKGSNILLQYKYPNLKVIGKTNFEICCSESRCDVSDLSPKGFAEWLPTVIIKYDEQFVTVQANKCSHFVKKIRYLWSSTPCEFKKCPIYDSMDFPASPFVMNVDTH